MFGHAPYCPNMLIINRQADKQTGRQYKLIVSGDVKVPCAYYETSRRNSKKFNSDEACFGPVLTFQKEMSQLPVLAANIGPDCR